MAYAVELDDGTIRAFPARRNANAWESAFKPEINILSGAVVADTLTLPWELPAWGVTFYPEDASYPALLAAIRHTK